MFPRIALADQGARRCLPLSLQYPIISLWVGTSQTGENFLDLTFW